MRRAKIVSVSKQGFYAIVLLDPKHVGRDPGRIADEGLSQLSTLPGPSLFVGTLTASNTRYPGLLTYSGYGASGIGRVG